MLCFTGVYLRDKTIKKKKKFKFLVLHLNACEPSEGFLVCVSPEVWQVCKEMNNVSTCFEFKFTFFLEPYVIPSINEYGNTP